MATPALSTKWSYVAAGVKSTVAATVAAATVASLLSRDAPAVILTSDAYVAEQLAAAQTAAAAMLAALTGAAPNCRVEIWGYSDPSTAAPMAAARGCRINVSVVEVWP